LKFFLLNLEKINCCWKKEEASKTKERKEKQSKHETKRKTTS